MATHRFNHPNDPTQGGTWFRDHGERMCDWSFDPATKTVRVTRYIRGRYVRRKRTGLINLGEQLLTPEELRERLPQLALETAQRMGKKPRGG
jgi:hypothetical protein